MEVRVEWDREPSRAFQRRLDEFNRTSYGPDVFVMWDPGPVYEGERVVDYEGRWEIWVELMPSQHPDAGNTLEAEHDRWLPDARCWARKLQPWQWPDGSYAPLEGMRFFEELTKNDGWAKDGLQELEEQEAQERAKEKQRTRDVAASVTHYYESYNSPIIGPHTSGDWRHKIR